MNKQRNRTPRAPAVKLVLSSEVIAQSKKRDSGHCMIASAVKVAYPDAIRISVDLQTIRFSDVKKGFRLTYLTPRIGQAALVRFDQGFEISPFEMTLKGAQIQILKPRTAEAKEKKRQDKQKMKVIKPGLVPTKIGGRAPPLGHLKDGVPFTRRRAFGIRALEL